MEASKCDELPYVTKLAEFIVKCSHLLLSHARSVPVEGGRQIVCQHLVRKHRMNTESEVACLLDARFRGFHPQQLSVRSISHPACDGVRSEERRDGKECVSNCRTR